MRKILLVIVLLVLGMVTYTWYSIGALPSWFDESVEMQPPQKADQLVDTKTLETLTGEVSFDEKEFNALLHASLERDADGRKLLQVSDAVKTFIHKDKLELTAIINLNKVEQVDPGVRKGIEQFDRIFPFIDGHRVALTVYATPVVREGDLGVRDDFSIKVGALPFTNQTLRGMGVEVERANSTTLALKNLTIESLQMRDQQIIFKTTPLP